MGNLVSQDVEGTYKKVCDDLVANDPVKNQSGCLHWASPPLKTEQLTYFMECLSKNTSLRRLVLRDLDALDDCPSLAKAIQQHAGLTCLGFNGRLPKRNFEVFVEAFLHSSSLNKLEIQNSIITPNTIDGLIAILTQQQKATNKLTSLALKGCQVEAADLARLTKALRETDASATLQILEISLKPSIHSVEAAQNLAEFFQGKDSALKEICLEGLLVDSVPVLMGGLRQHGSLQRLKLKGKGVDGRESIESIGSLLGGEAPLLSLRVLDLSDCEISAEHGSLLAKSFTKGTQYANLNELYLSNNLISNDGTVAISSALAKESSCIKHLKVLDVRKNQIGKAGIAALANAVSLQNDSTKPGLEQIFLGEEAVRHGRRFEEEDALAMAAMMSKNKTLQLVHMGDASFEDEGMEVLLESLSNNTTIKIWHVACFTTKSLQLVFTKLPELHLEKIHIRASGCELDETMSNTLLEKLALNKSLREFSIDGLTKRSELTWKTLHPKIHDLLATRDNESASSKRTMQTNSVELEGAASKRLKTDEEGTSL